MRTIALGAIAATLLASAATAAPLRPTESGAAEVAGIDQVRLICNTATATGPAGAGTSSLITTTTPT